MNRGTLRSLAAAALMIVLVHQPLVWLLHRAALVPWRAFDFTPLPPMGVPAVVSAIFWGALWGPVIELLGRGASVRRHLRAALGTAVLTTIVGALLIMAGRGVPVPGGAAAVAIAASLIINGAWAVAASALLPATGRGSASSPTPSP